ncbi:MAG TPA: hypothetical protein VIR30_20925 [Nocardioides sp.]
MSKRRRLVLVAAAVVVLAGAAGAFVLWPRGTTAVSEQEALDDFRSRTEETRSASASDAVRSDGPAALPAPGVYTYSASGQEEVKLGPLPADARPLPATVTAVVVDAGDGCFELTVNLFAEHTEDTRYCADPSGGLTLDGHTKHQRIGALSPVATLSCDPGTLIEPGLDTVALSCDLSLDGGPASINATLAGTATRGASDELSIGDQTVEVTPLTVTYEVSGDLTGTWTETLWLTETFLPAKIERSLDLSGPATFVEHSELTLLDLSPST